MVLESVGKLIYKNSCNDLDCCFVLKGRELTVLALDEETSIMIQHEILQFGFNRKNFKKRLIYGYDSDYVYIFHIYGILRAPLFYTINSKITFDAPLIYRKKITNNNELIMFDKIEFSSGIVNILYPPNQFEKYNFNCDGNMAICFDDVEKYVKTFKANIDVKDKNGIEYKNDTDIEVGIKPSIIHSVGKMIDAGGTKSYFKVQLNQKEPLDKLLYYVDIINTFFLFLVGSIKFNTEIFVYDGENKYELYINVSESNYSNIENVDCTSVISFNSLGDKLGQLFSLITNDGTKPILDFLLADQHKNYITKSDVIDICNALVHEYNIRKKYKSNDCDVLIDEAKNLADRILNYVVIDDLDERLRKKLEGIVNAYLKKYTPSTKEMLIAVYNYYINEIKFYANSCGIPELKSIKGYLNSIVFDSNEFCKYIKEFVNIKNSISHSFVDWNKSTDYYSFYLFLIYFSIFTELFSSYETCEIIFPRFNNWLSAIYCKIFSNIRNKIYNDNVNCQKNNEDRVF